MRPRPCSPGGYERRSTPHLSVRQRSPLRNSFCPSRRHCLHWGLVSLAMTLESSKKGKKKGLHAAPLARTTAVVGLRGDVLDAGDLQPGGLERADRRLASGTRALDIDLHLLKALLHALASGGVGGDLGGERGRLARALEARAPGRFPGQHVALDVGEGDDRVVERGLDVGLAHWDVLLGPAAAARWAPRSGHYFLVAF